MSQENEAKVVDPRWEQMEEYTSEDVRGIGVAICALVAAQNETNRLLARLVFMVQHLAI